MKTISKQTSSIARPHRCPPLTPKVAAHRRWQIAIHTSGWTDPHVRLFRFEFKKTFDTFDVKSNDKFRRQFGVVLTILTRQFVVRKTACNLKFHAYFKFAIEFEVGKPNLAL